ncbi:MAG: hypothetical protein ABH863_02770 [Candidatus Micrarchaeota archaeon]
MKKEENGGNATEFSRNLEELRASELQARGEIERAQKRREEIIMQGQAQASKILEDSEDEIALEKERIITKGRKETDKEVELILQKAQKEAKKLRKSANPRQAAQKLLPIILKT